MHEYTPITNPYQEKLSLFLVKTIRPQKNWGAHVHSHTKSHISGTKRSDPHLVPDADVWPLPEKELFLFLGLQFLQVFSNLKWWKSPSKTPTTITTTKNAWRLEKPPWSCNLLQTLFSGWTGILGEKKSLPTPMSHLSSPYAALWVRMSGLGRPGWKGDSPRPCTVPSCEPPRCRLDDQPAWPKTFLSWDGVKKPGLLWWNWPFSKRAIWYVQLLLYNKGRVCLGSGGFIVLPYEWDVEIGCLPRRNLVQ